jgi:hypothetical protein
VWQDSLATVAANLNAGGSGGAGGAPASRLHAAVRV